MGLANPQFSPYSRGVKKKNILKEFKLCTLKKNYMFSVIVLKEFKPCRRKKMYMFNSIIWSL